MRLRNEFFQRQLPALEEVSSGVFAGDRSALDPFISPTLRRLHGAVERGDTRALDPYVQISGAPYAAATQQAEEDVLRRTPASGGMLSQLLAQNALKGRMAQAQVEGQTRGTIAQQLLQLLTQQESGVPQGLLQALLRILAGGNEPTGTVATQTSDPGATGYLTTAANLGTAGAAIATAIM